MHWNGGFKLIDNGSKYSSPHRQRLLLKELLEDNSNDEKLDVYILTYWDNTNHQELQELFKKELGFTLIFIGRDIKTLEFHFKETVITIPHREGFSWTWLELIKVLKESMTP